MKWKGTFSSFFATVAALARSSAGPLRFAAGPLLTLAMAATIELLPLGRMSAAPLALVLTVGYSALTGGLRSGLVSGAIAAAFCGYYYWNARSAGPLQHYAEPDIERLVVLGMATPVVVLTLARLRKRVDLMSVRERQLRVQAEADRARLEDILESITDGFFALDRQWRYVYVNREAERLVCRGRGALVGKTVWESFPPLVGSAWEREYRRALEQNVAVHFEAFYAPLDTWLETHAYPSEAGLTTYMRSIDERKRAEQALCARALQQKAVARLGWQALTGAGPTPLMQAAVEAVASTLDVPLVKILEVRPDGELVLGAGVGWREGADHRVRADEPSQAAYTLARHEPVIVEDLATETRFHGPKLLFDHGAVSGVSVVIAGRHGPFGILGAHSKARRAFSQDDVSFVQAVANVVGEAIARRHAEEDLAESEQRFRQLADNVAEVFYVSAVQPLRMLYVSPAYEAVWGRACRSVYDDPASWLAAVHPDDRAAVEGCAWQSHDVEYRLVRPDGTERWIHDRASRVRGGSEERVVGIAEDVTTHKQAEERACRLATAEASVRARDEVLSVVAHDLRNPLHSIAMAAALLRQPQLDADRRARHAQVIARSVNVANRLVADLLDVSRIEAGQLVVEPEPIDPAAVLREVEDVFQLTARDKGLVLEVDAADALPHIAADRDRIVQVIGNLVGNAVKFTPPGGRIRVQATARRDGVEIAVSDTGPGIPREAVPHVFDRFWRARPAERRGLGLGLAIVRGIVQAHGGRVWAESELGAGSTFRFTMPLAATDGAGASMDGVGRPAP